MTSRSTVRRHRLGATALGVGLALLAFGFMAPQASAVDTNPTFVDDNPKCDDTEVGSFPSDFKIDEQPPDGDSTWTTADAVLTGDVPAGLEIEISNLVQGGDTVTFDWSATVADGDDAGTERDPFLIDRVLVKAGTGSNMWTYVPAVSSDTGLYSPMDSISHINFCFGPHEPPDTTPTTETPTTETPTTETLTTATPTTETPTTATPTTATPTTATPTTATAPTSQAVSPTTAQQAPASVQGVTVAPAAAALPATGANDDSLMIIGAGLALAGGMSLLLSNRAASATANRYQPKHRR